MEKLSLEPETGRLSLNLQNAPCCFDSVPIKRHGTLPALRKICLQKSQLDCASPAAGFRSPPASGEKRSLVLHKGAFKSSDRLPILKYQTGHSEALEEGESPVPPLRTMKRAQLRMKQHNSTNCLDLYVQRPTIAVGGLGEDERSTKGAKLMRDFSFTLAAQIARLNHKIDVMYKRKRHHNRVRFADEGQIIKTTFGDDT